MQNRYITIEGNIGAGKTTLAHLLQERLQAGLILEQFADNPFLPKFYEDRKRYSFPLELSFLAARYQQLKELLNTRNLFDRYLISDYLFIKSKLFARVNLEADEYRLYETLFEIIYPNLPEPDVVIFLQAPIEKLRQQIRQRNRAYEQQIPDQYLMDLQEAYSALLKSGKFKTLVIDTTSVDFLNQPRQLDHLLDYLTQDYTYGYHLLSFS